MELLDLPSELSYALQAGPRAESIVDLAPLEAAIWRWRACRALTAGVGTLFPGPMDGPFLEAIGLRPLVVGLLWGTWTPWGAPQLPEWLLAAWPTTVTGWEAGVVQALRADCALEGAGRLGATPGGTLGPAGVGALSRLAWAALLCPPPVTQALL
eukprot:12395252-Alexandrium_andersonii.AAC.1